MVMRLINASRRTASFDSAVSRTMARPSSRPAQPPTACTRRAPISTPTLGANVAARPPAVYSARPTSSVGRRPNTSDNGP